MSVKINNKIFVKFTTIFDEERDNLESYLTGISRSLLLHLMTSLSTFPDTESESGSYIPFLTEFFSEENRIFANEINAKLIKFKAEIKSMEELESESKLSIINPLTRLQIFQFCFDILTGESTQSNAEAERNIFKAILWMNEQIEELQDKAITSTEGISPELKPMALQIAHTFAYFDTVNYNIEEVLLTQLFKSIYLFEFLESDEEMKVLLAVFLDQFNCFDWKDFLKKCLPFLYQAVLEKSEGNRSIEVAQDENFKSNCKFLNNLTIVDTKDNLTISDSPSDDFTRLRERPLYQVSEGVFRIIYGLFFVEVAGAFDGVAGHEYTTFCGHCQHQRLDNRASNIALGDRAIKVRQIDFISEDFFGAITKLSFGEARG